MSAVDTRMTLRYREGGSVHLLWNDQIVITLSDDSGRKIDEACGEYDNRLVILRTVKPSRWGGLAKDLSVNGLNGRRQTRLVSYSITSPKTRYVDLS